MRNCISTVFFHVAQILFITCVPQDPEAYAQTRTAPCVNAMMQAFLRQPFAVALVFDASGSMSGAAMDASKTAGHAFVGRMQENDRAAILSFASTVTLHQDLASDRSRLDAAIDSIRAQGSTALYDAIFFAALLLEHVPEQDRFIILISDGADGSSTRSVGEALRAAQQSKARIIAFSLGPNAVLPDLTYLSGQSGGHALAVPDPASLPALLAALADSLTTKVETAAVSSPFVVETHPQPASADLYIRIRPAGAVISDMVLSDVRGNLISILPGTTYPSQDALRVQVSTLPPGMYFLTISAMGRSHLSRVLIAR